MRRSSCRADRVAIRRHNTSKRQVLFNIKGWLVMVLSCVRIVTTMGLVLLVLAALSKQGYAVTYYLNEALDAKPEQARVEAVDAVEVVEGRLSGQHGLLIRDGAVTWDLTEVDDREVFVEFWFKHHAWDALTDAQVLIAEIDAGEQRLTLAKAADAPVLELRLDDELIQVYDIYNWTQQPWMARGANDKDMWHYVNLGFAEAGEITFAVDAFEARTVTEGAAIEEALDRLALYGEPGTVFSTLHVIGDSPPRGAALRDRYRAMYRGKLALRQHTVTVPRLEDGPQVTGRADDERWRQAARLTNFTSLRGTDGQLVAEDIEVYLAYDEAHLYMALHTPYEGALDATHWGEWQRPLWQEESYEIFLLPPWTGQPDYKQLVGNPYGDQSDLMMFDGSWRGRWDWRTDVQDGRWTAELQTAFSGIDAPNPGEGALWNMNILNTQANAAWNWAMAYNDVGSFGILRFEADAPAIRPQRYEVTEDVIRAPLEIVGGRGTRDLEIRLEVYADGDVLPAAVASDRVKVEPEERYELTLEASRGELDRGKIVFFVRHDDQDLYYHTVDFPESPAAVRRGDGSRERAEETTAEHEESAPPDQMTDEERAYARTYTEKELGEELLSSMEWQDNEIGLSESVPSPWTPISVLGQTFSFWGRSYEYDDSILPVQILSQDEPLFAAAPYFVLRVDGKTLEFREAEVRIEQRSEGFVEVTAESRVDGYVLRLESSYEFDGLAEINLTLTSPAEALAVDGFELVFPLRADRSTLFHWATPTSGHPPYTDAGAVPEEGIELDQIRHLAWLGDEAKGFSWFTESLKHWQLRDEQCIQTVGPVQGDRRTFTIKFADRSFTLDEPWELLFGLQATPTRPRPANFRETSTPEATRFPWRWGEGEYYPWQDDHADAARAHVHEVRDEGRHLMPVSSLHFYSQFRYYSNAFGKMSNPGMMHREVMLWEPLWARTQLNPGLPRIPERHTSKGAWYGQQFHPGESTGGQLVHMCPASPFQDYYVWRLDQLVKDTGLSAIYLDQPMSSCSNPHHGCGYIDYKGEWSARYPLFDERRMLRRIHRVLYDEGVHDEPLIRWHSSNQLIVPLLSFANIFWDGENYLYGPLKVYEFYSDVLPEDRMRAQHTGIQFGFAPDLLPELAKSQDDRYAPSPASVRDMMGLFMVHDSTVYPAWTMHNQLVRFLQNERLKFPLDQMQVMYYWEDDPRLRVSVERVRHILHYNEQNALLVLFNWSGEPTRVSVELDLARLGLSGAGLHARDAVTGRPIGSDASSFDVPILPRDFRMVEIGAR